MSVSVTVSGVSYTIPQTKERGWGSNVTSWIQAVSSNTLQKNGGTFTLTADANFGATFGLLAKYFTSVSSNPAASGVFRLANAESVGWRNAANSADVLLTVNASDQLTYRGVVIGASTAALTFDALAPTTTKGDIIVRTSSTNARVGIGSDGQVPVADSTATTGLAWKTLQQGAKNYPTYTSFENNSTTGYHVCAVSVSSRVLSGAPTVSSTISGTSAVDAVTAASITTFGITSTNPLAGTYSLQVASSAAWTAGQGFCTDAVTIDREDRAKVLTFKVYYEVTSGPTNADFSGTNASSTFGWYIYDTANSAWIQPAGVYGCTQNSGPAYVTGTFQAPSNATSFRLVFLAVAASSGAVTINFDDFYLGPQTAPLGAVVTDWQSYTPSLTTSGGGNITLNATAVTNPNGYFRRVGDSIELVGSFKNGSGGSATGTAGSVLFGLPSGVVPDTAKLETNVGGSQMVGPATISSSSAIGTAQISGSTLRFFDSSGGVIAVSSLTANAQIDFRALIPVTGWSSTVQTSSDTDTRVVAAKYTSSSSVAIVNAAVADYATQVFDTHGAVTTGAAWKFTAPVSGVYEVSASFYTSSAAETAGDTLHLRLYKNAVGDSHFAGQTIDATATSRRYGTGTTLVSLNAGDYIDARWDVGLTNSVNRGGNSNLEWISVRRLSGPAVIAATESVNARMYLSTASATVPATSFVPFDTVTYDSHGACTVGVPASLAGAKFTAPVSGRYSVKACLDSASALWAANNSTTLAIHVNGSGTSSSFVGATAWAALTTDIGSCISDTVKLNAGDYVQIKWTHNRASATAISGSSDGRTYIAIERIGN